MNTQETMLRDIAKILNRALNEIYSENMGFMLITTPLDHKQSVCDYISNASRDDCIKWLRETADRLEKNETIPATKGNA